MAVAEGRDLGVETTRGGAKNETSVEGLEYKEEVDVVNAREAWEGFARTFFESVAEDALAGESCAVSAGVGVEPKVDLFGRVSRLPRSYEATGVAVS